MEIFFSSLQELGLDGFDVCSAVFFVTVEHDCNHSPIRNFVIL
jgi:hypothetical protein